MRHRRSAVFQNDELLETFISHELHHLVDRLHHAVGESLTGNDQLAGLLQSLQKLHIELGARVAGERNLGAETAVVLRPDVGALCHILHRGEVPALPLVERFQQWLVDVVTPAADQAVLRPDNQRLLPVLL